MATIQKVIGETIFMFLNLSIHHIKDPLLWHCPSSSFLFFFFFMAWIVASLKSNHNSQGYKY